MGVAVAVAAAAAVATVAAAAAAAGKPACESDHKSADACVVWMIGSASAICRLPEN